MLTPGMTSSASTEWGTPPILFDPLMELYDFTLDRAASHENAKVDRYCTAEGTFARTRIAAEPYLMFDPRDGLNFPWKDERVFLNPPWGDAESGIAEFLRKARNESLRNRALVVAIIPARMDTNWMHDYVLPYARVTWKRGRAKFIDPSGQARGAPPVGIGIAVYR